MRVPGVSLLVRQGNRRGVTRRGCVPCESHGQIYVLFSFCMTGVIYPGEWRIGCSTWGALVVAAVFLC